MIVDNSLYFLGHPVYRRTAIKQFAIWRTTKQPNNSSAMAGRSR